MSRPVRQSRRTTTRCISTSATLCPAAPRPWRSNNQRRPPSLLKEQRREFVQVAPPAQPLVSGQRRFVVDSIDAGLFQFFHIRLGSCAIFAAAVADENNFDLFLEVGHVFDL